MAAGFVGGEVALNGQTWVTVVAAPAGGKQRQVLSASLRNKDTVEHQYELRKKKGASYYELESPIVAQPGKGAQFISQCVVLDAIDETLEARTAEATTLNESVVDVSVFEVP